MISLRPNYFIFKGYFFFKNEIKSAKRTPVLYISGPLFHISWIRLCWRTCSPEPSFVVYVISTRLIRALQLLCTNIVQHLAASCLVQVDCLHMLVCDAHTPSPISIIVSCHRIGPPARLHSNCVLPLG